MQLGFVSAIFPDLALEEVLRFAAEEDYDCVEVMCWPLGKAERKFAGVTHVDVADFSQSKADDASIRLSARIRSNPSSITSRVFTKSGPS
jgi:hypothetical protein